mmetsp:Transcript_23814/g.56107  ORF Transcript_23814/g.56107 Transcript_23814/m.56107 type:complete len:242 (+) Transcript_23814:330-1055(+)
MFHWISSDWSSFEDGRMILLTARRARCPGPTPHGPDKPCCARSKFAPPAQPRARLGCPQRCKRRPSTLPSTEPVPRWPGRPAPGWWPRSKRLSWPPRQLQRRRSSRPPGCCEPWRTAPRCNQGRPRQWLLPPSRPRGQRSIGSGGALRWTRRVCSWTISSCDSRHPGLLPRPRSRRRSRPRHHCRPPGRCLRVPETNRQWKGVPGLGPCLRPPRRLRSPRSSRPGSWHCRWGCCCSRRGKS